MVHAVLFDVEGVLADTHAMHHNALNEALEPYGLEISLEELHARFAGMPTKEKLNILSTERGLDPNFHNAICQRKQELTKALIPHCAEPDASLQALILTLRTYGLKLAACSNSQEETILEILNSLGIAPWFDGIVGSNSVLEPKPSPEIYLEAARRIGVPIDNCLIVENSGIGLEAALAAGCFRLVKAKDPHSVKLGLFKPFLPETPAVRVA